MPKPARPTAAPRPSVSRTPAAAAPAVDETSSGEKLALYICLMFMFFRFSFLHEWVMTKIGFDSHMLLILGASAVISALISGGLMNGVSNKIFFCWLGFAVCMTLASAASIWRGGSLSVLYPYFRTTLILVVLIPAVAISSRSISLALKTAGGAGLVVILLGLTSNDFRAGRLELSGAGASISNSNDYAALLMLLMPAIAYLTMRRESAVVLKAAGVAALGFGCFLVLSTGSRGALISMMISALYILKSGSNKIRIAMLLGVPVVAMIALPFLPAESSARLASLFHSSNDASTEAGSSQLERTALLTESLRFTAQHPLLGVGPGTFAVYQAQQAEAKGQRGMWHETHNSYTQISSECGVPALLFYLTAIGMTFVVFRRARKSVDPEIRGIAGVLGLMLVSFAVCMFFLSQAYGFGFPVLGGFAISLDRLLKREEGQARLSEPLAA